MPAQNRYSPDAGTCSSSVTIQSLSLSQKQPMLSHHAACTSWFCVDSTWPPGQT